MRVRVVALSADCIAPLRLPEPRNLCGLFFFFPLPISIGVLICFFFFIRQLLISKSVGFSDETQYYGNI